MYTNFLVFLIFFFVVGEAADADGVFEELSDLNEKWLRATAFPEVAMTLKHPPYSYHSEIVPNSMISSDLYSQANGSYATFATSENEKSCGDDLLQVLFHIKSKWAMQMLDSDGKLSSGLLRGGLIWPGHFDECISTYSPKDKHGHGDFHGQYCATSWYMNVSEKYSNLPLMVGVCVPDSCSQEYLQNLEGNLLLILDRIPLLKGYSSMLTIDKVSCKQKSKTMDAASIIYFVFVSLFSSLSVVGTIMTLFYKWKRSQDDAKTAPVASAAESEGRTEDSETSEIKARKQKFLPHLSLEKELTNSDKAALTSYGAINNEIAEVDEKIPTESVMQRIWHCFSIFENGEKILNTSTSAGQLLSIHGIRFLSLTWVILGHTYISSVAIIGNRKDVLKYMDSFAFQMLLQSPFSVDSFFLLSGFLLAYLFLKEADKKSGKINWVYFYLHRIWRLTPAYMVVVFFYLFAFKYFGSGPFWDDDHCDASRGSWWRYLLYINNFIPILEMCVGWSWYLANDMQFYIISPLFLYPLWRWPKIGFSVLSAILIGTWTTTAVISYVNDLIPMFVGVTHADDFMAYKTKMWESFNLIYDKPYCRIAPYIIGVALGFILYKTNQRKNFLSWWQQVLGWMVASFCGLSVVFGLYHVEMSRTTALFYNSLCRSSFSIGLAWLIFVCETGHGSFLTKFLSWKFWIPLSRLTYCAYLIHPIFIHAYYQSYQSAFHFTEYIAVTSFLGFLIISYSAAFIFSVLFESPLMNLEKLVLKSSKK